MNREIVTLDVTEIEDRGWNWTVSHIQRYGDPFYSAYVSWDNPADNIPCTTGLADTPQGALDKAYREAEAVHCAVCHDPLGPSNGDCCSVQCEVEREARKVLA